jgi:zinc transport system permease protein
VELSALFDPLFRIPLLTGVIAAVVLPVLGAFLRLRDEWLAALGLAHLAAASGLAGMALGLPLLIGGSVGAVAGAFAKSAFGVQGNTAYALMILMGWSLTLLIAANTTLGEALAHAMVDGQLYFAGVGQLSALLLLGLTAFALLPWLMPRLLRARFFPEHERANRLPAWRWHLSFDLLVAFAMALGTATIGLMAAFAFVFIPPWIAFQIAGGWRTTVALSALFGLLAYLIGFASAIALDQPFGPLMVAVLLLEVPMLYSLRAVQARR